MGLLKLHQEINCDVPTFWGQFFDRELTRRLFLEGLGFHAYETLVQEETETEIRRTTVVEPKLNIPAPLAKAFGSSFRYRDEGVFDRATGVFRWQMIPGSLVGKVRIDATLRAEPLGPARLRRHVEFAIEARVFMLGGLIEDTFRKQLTEGWTRSAEIQNEWLRTAAG
jgi:hypothetical protein